MGRTGKLCCHCILGLPQPNSAVSESRMAACDLGCRVFDCLYLCMLSCIQHFEYMQVHPHQTVRHSACSGSSSPMGQPGVLPSAKRLRAAQPMQHPVTIPICDGVCTMDLLEHGASNFIQRVDLSAPSQPFACVCMVKLCPISVRCVVPFVALYHVINIARQSHSHSLNSCKTLPVWYTSHSACCQHNQWP